jgi:hypothetical protein
VLLRLCEPFLDPALDLFWKRVDARYCGGAGRLSFAEVRQAGAGAAPPPRAIAHRGAFLSCVKTAGAPHHPTPRAGPPARPQQDTKLAASAEEEKAWRDKQAEAAAGAPAPEFHFVCESYFMALKVGVGVGSGVGVGGRGWGLGWGWACPQAVHSDR